MRSLKKLSKRGRMFGIYIVILGRPRKSNRFHMIYNYVTMVHGALILAWSQQFTLL